MDIFDLMAFSALILIWVSAMLFIIRGVMRGEKYNLNDPKDRDDYEINRQFW